MADHRPGSKSVILRKKKKFRESAKELRQSFHELSLDQHDGVERARTKPTLKRAKSFNKDTMIPSHSKEILKQIVATERQKDSDEEDESPMIRRRSYSGTKFTLHEAIESTDLKSLSIILIKKEYSDIDAQNDLGQTALHVASLMENAEAIELLLQAGADVNILDKAGYSSLQYAVDGGSFDCASLLISNGANVTEVKDGF